MTERVMNGTAATVDVLTDASRRLAQLAAENERLRSEAAALRKNYAPGRNHRRVWAAAEDARTILHYRAAGLDVSRRWLDACGIMSQRRYGWALALLRLARVDLVPVDIAHLDRCLRKLDSTVERLLADGDITPLRARGHARIRFGG